MQLCSLWYWKLPNYNNYGVAPLGSPFQVWGSDRHRGLGQLSSGSRTIIAVDNLIKRKDLGHLTHHVPTSNAIICSTYCSGVGILSNV